MLAVAGAGIGGLAAAIALADTGVDVTVFERAPALGEVGAGLQLSPNACAALRRLGVLSAVETEAVALEALRIGRGRDGAVMADVPLGEAMSRRYGAPFLVTRRADLHRVLRRRAEEAPNIRLVLGARVTGWSPAAGGVRLAFEDPTTAPCDARGLVGADGLHSAIRAQMAPGQAEPRTRGTAFRATIDAAEAPADFRQPASRLWLGHHAHVVHYPVARGRLINVVVALDDAPTWAGKQGRLGDAGFIAGRLAGWAAPIRRLIASAEHWGTWPLVDRPPLRAWSSGPVTLLGDAAHPMLPFLAQGAAQALEDAVALGHAVTMRPDNFCEAFRRYEARRRPRATRVQGESRRQARIYHLPPPASSLRDVILRAGSPKTLLSRYDWLYAHSACEGDGPYD